MLVKITGRRSRYLKSIRRNRLVNPRLTPVISADLVQDQQPAGIKPIKNLLVHLIPALHKFDQIRKSDKLYGERPPRRYLIRQDAGKEGLSRSFAPRMNIQAPPGLLKLCIACYKSIRYFLLYFPLLRSLVLLPDRCQWIVKNTTMHFPGTMKLPIFLLRHRNAPGVFVCFLKRNVYSFERSETITSVRRCYIKHPAYTQVFPFVFICFFLYSSVFVR